MKNIPIFFSFDNNYTIPAAVAFYSLLNKAKDDVFYEMIVLHSDISEENQRLLEKIVNLSEKGKIIFKNTQFFLDDYWKQGNFEDKNKGCYFTVDTIVRCFAAKFLPEYDKVIYSDVDIVVMDDISELYDVDLTNKYIGACKSVMLQYEKEELSHLKPEHYNLYKDSYFIGGIWVLNLKKIREDNLEEKMIDIIKDNTIIKRWNDQDIMNIACENKVAYIPINYISYPNLDEYLVKDDFISPYTREELYDSIINPKIIHYAAVKPWNSVCAKTEIWWDIFHYLNLPITSIFKSTKPKNVYLLNSKLKRYRKLFKFFLYSSIFLFFIIIYLSFFLI